jgi:hypothetical protein
LGDGESRRATVCIEAINQAGQHCYDTGKHFFPGANAIDRDEAFGDRRIKAGGALEYPATGSSKNLARCFAVSFGRVQKHREAWAVKLFDQLPPMLGRPMRGIIQKRCNPGDESEFNAIDIEFIVVKKGIHPAKQY